MERVTLDHANVKVTILAPLFGECHKGGRSREIRPEDSVHTLNSIHPDAGIAVFGSILTNRGVVDVALKALEPFYRRENAVGQGGWHQRTALNCPDGG